MALNRKEHEQRLADVLAQLSPADRDVLRRLYFQKQTVRDAAEALGLTEGAVRKRHFDALRRLRKVWKGRYGEEGLQL
jgi:RNA polymerase sigma-70 factor (ECF subfamily)